MRHSDHNRKFGREESQRRAFVRSLACSLILREKIRTTEARAKEIRPVVEKLVTRAKNSSVANRRLISARLATEDKKVAKKLFDDIAPRYADRKGGYTRVTKLAPRKSDGAKMAVIEFVS